MPSSDRNDSCKLVGDAATRPATRQAGKTYSAEQVAAVGDAFRKRLDGLINEHQELVLARDEFEHVLRDAADPLQELAALLEASAQVLVQLKHLVNPTALPLDMSEDGRVLTHTFNDVATFVTDIRGFTELTFNVMKLWGTSVFDVLSYCYFPQITELLERYGCHYLNYTGDGLLVLAMGRRDGRGKVLLPSLDVAVLCAMDMTALTNSIAEAWRRMGLVQSSGTWHETGLGLASGDVDVGDPFVPDKAFRGKCAQFSEVLREILAERMPHFQPRSDFAYRVRAIHAMSPAINRASRLQDTDKSAPQHTCMMTAPDVAKLCPPLRSRFVPVGKMMLKGIGEVDVLGFDRFERHDVVALENECLAHYAGQS